MANKKISEMPYKQLTTTDQIPTVNSALPGENNYAFANDIPLLVGISVWDSSAIYTVGHLVIYNSSTVSGIFRVTATTSAGDAPEGTGYAKFESYCLSWINNAHGDNDNISYERTGYISVSLTGANVDRFLLSSSLISGSTSLEIATSYKVTCSLVRYGVSSTQELISIKSIGLSSGQIGIYVENTGSALGGVYIAYTIEG